MDKQILIAQKRTVFGRKVKKLRHEGILPANVFGKKIKSEAVQVSLKDFEKVYKEAGETGLLNLVIEDGKKKDERAVLVSNLQLNAVSDSPVHVDFRQVDLKEKVTAKVPVELAGEAPAEKSAVGTAVLYISEIEVEALPGDLPDKFVVDVSNLSEVDQAIYVKDLSTDRAKVTLNVDAETIVVKVEPPQKEEVVAPPAPAEGEVPVEGEAVAEGAPAEATGPESFDSAQDQRPAEGGKSQKESPKEEPKK